MRLLKGCHVPHTHRRTEGFKRQKNCFEVFIQYSDDVVSGKKMFASAAAFRLHI